jgi:hypothetical protein
VVLLDPAARTTLTGGVLEALDGRGLTQIRAEGPWVLLAAIGL